MSTLQGGCCCGAVRYVTTEEPVDTRACWCRVCQYFAAGNASVNLVFRSEAVAITGTLSDFPSTAASGNHMHRRFCPTCGTHVTSAAEQRPHLLVIRSGTLDDAGRYAPRANIWTASAPSWAHIDESLPGFAGQPPPPPAKA
jgi:hypothetical protein